MENVPTSSRRKPPPRACQNPANFMDKKYVGYLDDLSWGAFDSFTLTNH